ncbi:hypothetical protein [Aureimonas sp. N4]|uniref:hypothetical protein n=1 Tax=Aureimonas sp. N4 TaxID=1638165 RepID=UPI0012E3C06B
MWTLSLVVLTPALDDAGLGMAVEDFAVQAFVPKLGDDALAIAILSREAWLGEDNHGTDRRDPVAHCLGSELVTIVGADVSWRAALDQEVGQNIGGRWTPASRRSGW